MFFLVCVFVSACKVETQLPLEFFFEDAVINFNEMEKKYGKNKFVFFQRQMSSSGEERTFVIGLPSQKKGLVLTVNNRSRDVGILPIINKPSFAQQFRIKELIRDLYVISPRISEEQAITLIKSREHPLQILPLKHSINQWFKLKSLSIKSIPKQMPQTIYATL